jgi:hypothetical protein
VKLPPECKRLCTSASCSGDVPSPLKRVLIYFKKDISKMKVKREKNDQIDFIIQ